MFSFSIEPSLNTDLYVYTTNVFVFTFNRSKTEFVVFLMQMKKKLWVYVVFTRIMKQMTKKAREKCIHGWHSLLSM